MTTGPEFERVGHWRWWRGIPPDFRNVSDIAWDVGRKGSGDRVVIPAGTVFNSSVPWALWWVQSPAHPRFLLAALVHDVILGLRADADNPASPLLYTREHATAEWMSGARALDAPRLRARLAFVAIAIYAAFARHPAAPR